MYHDPMVQLKIAGRSLYTVRTAWRHEAGEVVEPPYKEYPPTLRTWGFPLGNPHELLETIKLRNDRLD